MSQPEQTTIDDVYYDELLDLLYDVDNSPVTDFYIWEERGDENQVDDGKSVKAYERINILCRELGIDPINYAQYFIKGESGDDVYNGVREISTRVVEHAIRHSLGLGQFVTDMAYMALPIESGDDSVGGGVALSFRSKYGFEVVVKADGSFDNGWPEPSDGEDESDEESVLSWRIKYTADVQKALDAGVAGEEVAD